MSTQERNFEEHRVETKHDSSKVAATFIKYFAYVVITFGVLYFIAKYVIPEF